MVVKKQKKSQEGINSKLALVMKSGKYCLGLNQTLKTLRKGECKNNILYTPHFFFCLLNDPGRIKKIADLYSFVLPFCRNYQISFFIFHIFLL